ncbi:MAG: peptidylprolyl isomerase [Candidatus Xenobia bacterium]
MLGSSLRRHLRELRARWDDARLRRYDAQMRNAAQRRATHKRLMQDLGLDRLGEKQARLFAPLGRAWGTLRARILSIPFFARLTLRFLAFRQATELLWARTERPLFYALTIVGALAAGYAIAAAEIRHTPGTAMVVNRMDSLQGRVEATINGEHITGDEFYSALKLVRGRRVLLSLLEQKAVLQKAAQEHLTVSDGEVLAELKSTESRMAEPIADADMRKLLAQQIRCRLLLRKMILPGITEAEKQKVYDAYKDDLTQYQVSDILVASEDEAEQILTTLKAGARFETLATTRSVDKATAGLGGDAGFLTLPAIRRAFGPTVADAVRRGEVHGVRALPGANGWVVLRLGEVRNSYEALKPTIEDLLVASRRNALVRQLMSQATISSRYIANPLSLEAAVHQQSK